MAKPAKRHLKAVPDQGLSTEITNEDLEALLSEETDEEFGIPEFNADKKPVKLKDWKAEDFASIYTRFRPHLERHARKYLNNQSQIDEVVQDAFLYLMVSLPELDSEIGVLKFMKWKVKNLCIDIYRVQGKAYINSIDDIAEPQSNDATHDELLEQADDAAVVKLALSKLNPRHREVLVAQIYEEKTIEEIAMQIQLSENATRQLSFRARAAFKKALLGDVDTDGMSMAKILSVAARKAAEEAKKTGVQAMVLVLFLALSIGAFFSQNSNPGSNTVAEGPVNSNSGNDNVDLVTPVIPGNQVSSATTVSVRTTKEVALVDDLYQENPIEAGAANAIADANQSTNVVVYRASKTSGVAYRLEAAEGVTADFNYDATGDPIIKDLVFTIMVKGIQYSAFGQNVKIQQTGSQVYLVGQLTDLIDINGLVYGGNALAKASIQLNFDASDLTKSGTFSILKKS